MWHKPGQDTATTVLYSWAPALASGSAAVGPVETPLQGTAETCIKAPRKAPVRLSRVIAEYLYYVNGRCSKRTHFDYKTYLHRLEKFIASQNRRWSQDTYNRWIDFVPSPNAKAQCRRVMSAFMNWAVKNGRLPVNYDTLLGPIAAPMSRDRDLLTTDDYRQLKDATAGTPAWQAIVIGYWTGLRIKDCCHLSWAQVDLDKMVIQVRPSKTGLRHSATCLIPIMDQTDLHLSLLEASRLRETGQEYVYPPLVRLYKQAGGSQIRAAFKLANISPDPEKAKSFHDLRRAFITRCINVGGMDWTQVAKMTGHKKLDVFAKYVLPDANALRRGLSDSFGKQLTPGPVGAAGSEIIGVHKSNIIQLCQPPSQTESESTALSK